MGKQIAVQGPAALHKMPGIYRHKSFRKQFPSHQVHKYHGTATGEQLRQPDCNRPESQHLQKGDHAIGKQYTHLPIAPCLKMRRKEHPEPICPIL